MTLLYFSPVPWNSYPQRPHAFVRHFLRDPNRTAIWIDPYPTRLPVLADLVRPRGHTLSTPHPPNLRVVTLPGIPVDPLPVAGEMHGRLLRAAFMRRVASDVAPTNRIGIVTGRPSRLALATLRALPHAWAAYDAMDDFPEFYRGLSRRSALRLERQIVEASDVVLVSSQRLWDKFHAQGPKRVLVRNAFEMRSLPPVETSRNGVPVFGYIGCVGAWFDWALVEELARRVPAARVEIVGPRVHTPHTLPANIVLRPACSHEQAVAYMQHFTVGLIPFARTPLTDSVDPIKYYAYRAMGLAVLTTRFGEMGVHGPDDSTFFLERGAVEAAATSAANARIDPASVACFREAHDWERRFLEAGLFDRTLPA